MISLILDSKPKFLDTCLQMVMDKLSVSFKAVLIILFNRAGYVLWKFNLISKRICNKFIIPCIKILQIPTQ